jgi:hypothetical protein
MPEHTLFQDGGSNSISSQWMKRRIIIINFFQGTVHLLLVTTMTMNLMNYYQEMHFKVVGDILPA